MLQDNLLLIISLLFLISLLAMLSDKLRISYPIFLVIAGLLISLVPGIPRITLDPDTLFIIFLPPLLYASAWNTSWHDFWRLRRPIGLLAMGLVVFTAGLVALVSYLMIPGFPRPLASCWEASFPPPTQSPPQRCRITRLQSQSVWNVIVFLLNGVVFILIGLQLHGIVRGLGEYSLSAAIFYGIVISLITIFIRLIWVFPAAYIPRIINKRIRKKEPHPSWKSVFIIGWSGMKGVVSLASALAFPLSLTDTAVFPHRNLILFITFTVILFTLVLQGLSLLLLIRLLKVEVSENERLQVGAVRLRLAKAALKHIEAKFADEVVSIDAFHRLKARYERMVEIANKKTQQEEGAPKTPLFLLRYRKMLLELVTI